MEKEKGAVEEIVDDLKIYIDTNIELYKLQTIEKSAVVFSSLTINLALLFFGALVLLFLSIAMALAISEAMNHAFSGFLIVAGLYGLALVVVFITKDKWLKSKLINSFIKTVLSK